MKHFSFISYAWISSQAGKVEDWIFEEAALRLPREWLWSIIKRYHSVRQTEWQSLSWLREYSLNKDAQSCVTDVLYSSDS